jgi:hypothetical protein
VKPELVKPETALFLEKSHELLERADTMMGVGLTDDAGRAAYLAARVTVTVYVTSTRECPAQKPAQKKDATQRRAEALRSTN